ncbi:MAG: hypothetical protein K5873_07450, partial [Treponema sp.]|nr:hypothetical protein [Treponema sp.]
MSKPFNVARFTTMVLTCALFGIFDFYMYFFSVYLMELPVFCDMIFCIAISFFAGPFFGCLSVIFKNIYDNIVTDTTPLQYLYCI